jgi:glutamyl-tRNA reductase
MSLLLVGLNHKTAPVEVRERFALTDEACGELLPRLADGEIVREALILSTCNRVEILVESDSPAALEQAVSLLAEAKGVSAEAFADYTYQYADQDAVKHLFRVASSLDSMIVGENQILGQVRKAYALASEAQTARRILHKLLHHTFHAAKRVRTETKIASNAVSISFAAVELARKVFGTLSDKTVLLVGAGEMAELAAKCLIEQGAKQILIANRTLENAVKLAIDFNGQVVAFENLAENLPQADIVICSTAAQDYLITAEMVAKSQKERLGCPALLIDISVPRNIEPTVSKVENAFLYAVDDLETVVTNNLEERLREAESAEAIVESEVAEFWHSLKTMSFGEKLGAVRQKMQATAQMEFAKQRGRLGNLTPEQELAIEKLLLSTVNQIAHPILYGLRQSHQYGAGEFAETLCDLLNQEK